MAPRSIFVAIPMCAALGGLLTPLAGCKDDPAKVTRDNPPPPPPPAASAKPNVCASGGGEVKDPTSKDWLPRTTSGYCIDPNGDAMVYGDKEKHSMDEVCTKEFDGECEIYKKLGLKRVVSLRYVDGSGAPNNVVVFLDQFADPGGAYAMFTTRVVAGADPMKTTVKPLVAGGAAAVGSTNAYVWKGSYLIELNFVPEDPNMTKEQMATAGRAACSGIGKAIADKLPGTNDKLPAVKALPDANLVSLGVSYVTKDALGVAGLGAAAVGYYKDGDKRYRMLVLLRDDVDQAKDAMKLIKGKPGAFPIKDVGDDAVAMVVQEAKDRPKAEYVFSRKGNAILVVGDEELVLTGGDAPDKLAALKLTRDEKLVKLRAWTALPPPAASLAVPSASASAAAAPSGSAAAPKK